MDQIVSAIRKRAAERGLRPHTLAKQGSLNVSTWQVLLDREDIKQTSHQTVMIAAEQLGLKVSVK